MDNLAKKVDDCPPKSGSLSIVGIQLGPRKLSVIRSSGCPLFRGCLSIEMNGRTVVCSYHYSALYTVVVTQT